MKLFLFLSRGVPRTCTTFSPQASCSKSLLAFHYKTDIAAVSRQ